MVDSLKILQELNNYITYIEPEKFTKTIESLKSEISKLLTKDGRNSKQNIVFHLICSNESTEENLSKFIDIVVETIRALPNSGEIIREMLNQKTNDYERSPLFVVTFNNKKNLVKKFIELGADPKTTDREGQSLLHLCASYSYLSLLCYFVKEVKLNIYCLDNDKRTPLHLAAFEGKEQSCKLLISWTQNFELKDKDGFTPLHLAAFSDNYIIIRHMIMRGASRKEITPPFNAESIGNIMNVSLEVRELLKQPSCLQSYNFAQPPITQAKKSPTTFIVNLIIMTLKYIITVIFIYPYCITVLDLVSVGLGFFGFFLLISTSLKDPGYQQKGGNLEDLYSKYKEEYICSYCDIIKEKSMKHCQQCNRCVKKFDHHCPWVNNCIGYK